MLHALPAAEALRPLGPRRRRERLLFLGLFSDLLFGEESDVLSVKMGTQIMGEWYV